MVSCASLRKSFSRGQARLRPTQLALLGLVLLSGVATGDPREGCQDPLATVQWLKGLRGVDWNAWSRGKAFAALPDAAVSRQEGTRQMATLARTGRLISGRVECEESLAFELPVGGDDSGPWVLRDVIVIYTADGPDTLKAAESLFLSAIQPPEDATIFPTAGVIALSAPKGERAAGDGDRMYSWNEGAYSVVVRVAKSSSSRIWLKWEKEGRSK